MRIMSLSILFFCALQARAEIFVNCGQETNFGDYLNMVEDWQYRVQKAGVQHETLVEARKSADLWLTADNTFDLISKGPLTAIDGAKLIELKENDRIFRACAIFEGSAVSN